MRRLFLGLLILVTVSVFAEWRVEVREDPMTDEKRVTLSSPPIDAIGAMMFRRNEGDVLVGFNTALSIKSSWGTKTAEFLYRVDDEKAIRSTATATELTGAVFLKAEDVINIIKAKRRLILQSTRYNGTIIQLIFDMGTFQEKYQEYLAK